VTKSETPSILAGLVDRLAEIKAQTADLTAEADTIKEFLISSNMPAIEGTLHRATVSLLAGRERVDWETIARRFDPSHQLIAAHTTHGDPYHMVRVSARKGGK
jgi:hypothetical protein